MKIEGRNFKAKKQLFYLIFFCFKLHFFFFFLINPILEVRLNFKWAGAIRNKFPIFPLLFLTLGIRLMLCQAKFITSTRFNLHHITELENGGCWWRKGLLQSHSHLRPQAPFQSVRSLKPLISFFAPRVFPFLFSVLLGSDLIVFSISFDTQVQCSRGRALHRCPQICR